MFRAPTVFILGAGASAEVDLPVGEELLRTISSLVNLRYSIGELRSGDPIVADALDLALRSENRDHDFENYRRSAMQLVKSAEQAISIDNLVHGLEDEKIELVAKLGIVRAIHLAENESRFFKSDIDRNFQLDFRSFEPTWYSDLSKLITEGRRKSDVESFFENLSFISFNYDRCIEAFLPRAISSYFGLPVDEVVAAFKEVTIHRPYGIAGEVLDWPNGVPSGFGKTDSPDYLLESSRKIRTFTEGVEDPNLLNDICKQLEDARRIVFLGSAFHRQNLELLRCAISVDCKVFATCSSISRSDLSVVEAELREVLEIDLDDGLEFAPMHCKQFFQEYWRTLTAE